MAKYQFVEPFSLSGKYYPQGQVAELTPEDAALIPEGIAEQVEEAPPPPTTPKTAK